MYNEPEWASVDEWNAYAWFGFAVSEAQAVERLLLVIAVAITSIKPLPNYSPQPRRGRHNDLDHLTPGNLVKFVRPYGVLADDILKMLADAVRARNALAHEFFVPRTDKINSSVRPPIDAQKELQKAASLFSNLAIRLESIVWPLLEEKRDKGDAVERGIG